MIPGADSGSKPPMIIELKCDKDSKKYEYTIGK